MQILFWTVLPPARQICRFHVGYVYVAERRFTCKMVEGMRISGLSTLTSNRCQYTAADYVYNFLKSSPTCLGAYLEVDIIAK